MLHEALTIVGWIFLYLVMAIQGVVALVVMSRGKDQSSFLLSLAVMLMTIAPPTVSIALWLDGRYWLAVLAYVVGWVSIVYANKLVERHEALEEQAYIAQYALENSTDGES